MERSIPLGEQGSRKVATSERLDDIACPHNDHHWPEHVVAELLGFGRSPTDEQPEGGLMLPQRVPQLAGFHGGGPLRANLDHQRIPDHRLQLPDELGVRRRAGESALRSDLSERGSGGAVIRISAEDTGRSYWDLPSPSQHRGDRRCCPPIRLPGPDRSSQIPLAPIPVRRRVAP